MNNERIFVGNIMHNGKIVEENVKFLQCKFDLYVKYDHVEKIADICVINFTKKNIDMFGTTKNDKLYIDIDSLMPYVKKNDNKVLGKVRKIKRTVNA